MPGRIPFWDWCSALLLAEFHGFRYYTNYIKSRSDWEFVSVYTDEGITGCNTKRREGFKTMIADALAGRIDLIVTKSVSRFARNTVDSLTTIRKLKEHGTEVYFEKENIWTFDGKGELLLTIMSSLAQEESRSISENCTWGQRKRFADGKVTVPFGRFLGYDRGSNGELLINEEQAKIVRKIYGYFLQGRSPYQIAKLLAEQEVPTPSGKGKWCGATVKSILTNEKYKGDALLQKSITVDFLTKKIKANEGEVPQYYVEGDHEAIIQPEIFDRVQILMEARSGGRNRSSSVNVLSGKIKCGGCGSWYGSKVWHSNDKYRRVIWQCNHKFDGGEKCSTPHLDEETIKQLFIKALNILAKERDLIIAGFDEIKDTAFSTEVLEAEAEVLNGEVNTVAELIQKCIDENARVAQDQSEYQKRYDALVQRFETAKAKLDEVQAAIAKTKAQRQMMENFMETLRSLPEQVEIFDEGTWYALCDYITVYGKDDIRVTFQNGTDIRV